MTEKVIMVIKPRINGLEEYMAKCEKLSELLTEAISIYGELKGAVFEVDYEVESPTLND